MSAETGGMESNPGFVLVKSDIENALNGISRSRILHVLEESLEIFNLA